MKEVLEYAWIEFAVRKEQEFFQEILQLSYVTGPGIGHENAGI